MNNLKVVFTDSGLGGLTIMADFAKLVKYYRLNVDLIYFNAQHSRSWGYKKMDSKTQIEVFNSALLSMYKQFEPDIIAIACNTLSVVYLKTDFYKQTNTKVLDIIKTGQALVKNAKSNTIVEVAMPTTIDSGIYGDKNKNIIAVASDTSLPDAIENGDYYKIDQILKEIFKHTRFEMTRRKLINIETALFLGCTHFPIIKNRFLEIADYTGIKITNLLNPNAKFSQLILEEILKKKLVTVRDDNLTNSENKIIVVSRVEFNESEIKNISGLIENISPETAEALRNYEHNTELF